MLPMHLTWSCGCNFHKRDAAACDEGKTRVYSVEAETWSLVEHRCETDESDKVWVVAQVERLGAFALVIDDAPVSPTPTPVAAAVRGRRRPPYPLRRLQLQCSAYHCRLSRRRRCRLPCPRPCQCQTGRQQSLPRWRRQPTPTAVPAGNEPSAPMMQASAGDGGSGGFGRIILAALGVPMLIGTLIVVYLLYRGETAQRLTQG